MEVGMILFVKFQGSQSQPEMDLKPNSQNNLN